MKRRIAAQILVAVLLLAGWSLHYGVEARLAPIPDATIAGPARITDGDTIEIADTKIRLHGIDAPELHQQCSAAKGGTWPCGLEAARLLRRLTASRPVACVPRGHDKYGRTLAVCSAGGLEINAELVRQGLAWAFVRYSSDYVAIEAEARAARRGVFQADTQTPWDLRTERWQAAAAAAPAGCAIKGNVNARGERIYHLPWQGWYGDIRMDKGRGERWFCSEDEAIAAGWRRSAAR